MLENFVPSGYASGVRGLIDKYGFLPSWNHDDFNDASSYRRLSADEEGSDSDYEQNQNIYPQDSDAGRHNFSDDGRNSGSAISSRHKHSRPSSQLTGDSSSAFMGDSSSSSDEDEEDEDDDEGDDDEDDEFDDDEDDFSAFDGIDDEDTFDSAESMQMASRQTYREFRRVFNTNDVPKSDTLYKAYSCALSKEILYQGRMFVTTHYVCFISRLFTTHKLVIPFSSITKIEPKMMMNFIPNSIAIRTNDDKRYTFASFTNRNRTMSFLRKLRNSRLISSGSTAGANDGAGSHGTHDTGGQGTTSPRPGSNRRQASNGGGGGGGDAGGNNNTLPLRPISSASRIRSATLPSARGDQINPSNYANNNNAAGLTANEGKSSLGNRPSALRSHSAMAETHIPPKTPPKTPTRSLSTGSLGDESKKSTGWPVNNLGPSEHAKSTLPPPGENEKVLATETIPAPLGVVANILFGKDTSWYKHFLVDVEKNKDLNEFPPFPELKDGSQRSFEYTKPLNGPVGPKQTQCNCTEKVEKWDMEEYIEVITTTATPDVPSGSSFTTLTRCVIAWGDNNTTQIRLGTWLEWTGKSWLKGPIEKGAIDGQTSYCKDLVSELSKKINSKSKPEAAEDNAQLRPASVDIEKEAGIKQKTRKSSTAKRAAQAIKEWQQLCTLLTFVVILLLILLVIVWHKSSKLNALPTSEQQHEALRIQQELEMWQWIDDRKDSAVNHRQTLTDANIREAIAVTEKRIAHLKASLC